MAERPTFIVDASVVARWYVANPPYVAEALHVRTDFQNGWVALFAPRNLRYEVTGAIHRAVVARYLRAPEGETQLRHFLDSQVTLVDADPLILPAFQLSMRYGCSFYEAIYLAVAETTMHPFLHADASLRRALGSRFPLELWIEDYRAVLP